MKARDVLVMAAGLLLAGCAGAPPESMHTSTVAVDGTKQELALTQLERRTRMLGRWYGSSPTREGGRTQWIVERVADGSYRTRFRLTESTGRMREWQEVGIWGVAGDIYFSIFTGWLDAGRVDPADPTDAYNYDAYRILSLEPARMEYESVDSENRFVVRKVDDAFLFPEALPVTGAAQ